jgi:DEAD/DEAH box helicase domain-containing protein
MSNSISQQFIAATEASVVERIDIPARGEVRASLPQPYAASGVANWLEVATGSKGSVWKHQALGLGAVATGENLVISTGTASGKSLVFMVPTIHELLTGEGTILILFPQKALGGDQFMRISKALEQAGLDPGLVGEVHGDITLAERDRVISDCRVVLATPDAAHCWLMRQTTSPAVQGFLRRLRYLVLDEAHVYEGVFGSNSAFFLRRLRAAVQNAKSKDGDSAASLQIIAATATIVDPATHLRELTGCSFASVTEKDNGAPFHGLTLLHVDGPAYGGPSEKLGADFGTSLAGIVEPNAFIMFADSRQGVERITASIGSEVVKPYRGGYKGDDRRQIEQALRLNKLAGVVSTSALELGIDIPQFTMGLNLGVPQTRKAFRQRVGRIGRSMPGVFALVAPASTFTQLGSSFRDFYEGLVEESHLYLGNRFIQFQQACCFVDEFGDLDPKDLHAIDWPQGFDRIVAAARPGSPRPRDLDHVAAKGSDSPQHAFPLRNICETTYALRSIRNPSEVIGKIELDKALSEAYPGAVYRHFGVVHRVTEWRTTSYEQSIMLEPVKNAQPTQPMSRTQVSVSIARGDLIDQRLDSGPKGLLAEISMRVSDSVEGILKGSTAFPYRDLQQQNRHMRRRQREFTTTGVLLRIEEPWFAGGGEAATKMRRQVATALKAVLATTHSIAPAELRTAHSNISLCGAAGPRIIDDAIVVFDNVCGGVRLSAPLFSDLENILGRLQRAAELAGAEALLSASTVERLMDWQKSLERSAGMAATLPDVPEGHVLIFAPQSRVGLRLRGEVIERTLLEPQFVSSGDEDILMYQYDTGVSGKGWVAHNQVEPVGSEWRYALWDPAANAIREIAA